jgi:hypothetical protein
MDLAFMELNPDDLISAIYSSGFDEVKHVLESTDWEALLEDFEEALEIVDENKGMAT